jgi:hypothetical protein
VKRFLYCLAALIMLIRPPTLAASASLEELQQTGRLLISTQVSPVEGLVPGQKGRLMLEIATDRWFVSGTRIRVPEVPGLVILQTEQFASNASENRGGQSWVIQRWTLDIYAQRAGNFSVPPMAMELAVNGGESGNVRGQLFSPPVDFTVEIPAALDGVEQWVAAPSFNIEQHFDRDLESLRPGDAFERQLVFEAADVMAMMLPEFKLRDIPGLAVYPAPPDLVNRSNRGETVATRSLKISYVVESEGEYLLPGEDFMWWDTETTSLQVLSLPPVSFTVGPPGSGNEVDGLVSTVDRAQWLMLAAGLSGLLVLAGVLYRLYPHLLKIGSIWIWIASQWKVLRQPALPDRLNP